MDNAENEYVDEQEEEGVNQEDDEPMISKTFLQLTKTETTKNPDYSATGNLKCMYRLWTHILNLSGSQNQTRKTTTHHQHLPLQNESHFKAPHKPLLVNE